MASENRTASHYLELCNALQAEPYNFGFFNALRRIECAHPEKPRIGQSLRPGDDPIRLTQTPSMAFAPSTLSEFKPQTKEKPAQLASYFFGLLGPNGPLPLHLTEHACDRITQSRDYTFSRFLDVFHQRMLSLFYRAWAIHEPTVSFDRQNSDRFSMYVGALFGLGMSSLLDRDQMPDNAKRYFAGMFANQTRHLQGLKALLANYFSMPVGIEEFVGEWVSIPEYCQIRLSRGPTTITLGETSNIGERVWMRQLKYRLEFGPLNLAQFKSLLPGSDNLPRLAAIVRNYVGDELSWDMKLILKRAEIPTFKLDGSKSLGWISWLHSDNRTRECEETIINYTSIINSGETNDRN